MRRHPVCVQYYHLPDPSLHPCRKQSQSRMIHVTGIRKHCGEWKSSLGDGDWRRTTRRKRRMLLSRHRLDHHGRIRKVNLRLRSPSCGR